MYFLARRGISISRLIYDLAMWSFSFVHARCSGGAR